MSSLNASQRLAVEQTSGSLLILAGPGTGKTRVLIAKILRLIESGIPPESILAVTFSRRATQEMEDRLSETKAGLAERVNISTLHALCIEIVESHAFRIGFEKKPQLVSEAEAFLFFKKVSEKLPLEKLLKTSFIDPIIEDLLTLLGECKDEGLWPEDLLRYATSLPEETEGERLLKEEWQAIGDIYNAYQGFCFAQGYLDFGDAILCALRILKEFPHIKEEYQRRYKAILVDEFQDTNWSQIQLLKDLTADSTHIAVVGDDDQSIYKFRGASYSAFKFFADFFSEHKIIDLNETYRLPPSVVKVASELIKANGDHRFRPDKTIRSMRDDCEPVSIIKATTHEQEAQAVADEIITLIKGGVQPEQIGILVRSKLHGDFVRQRLEAAGIQLQSSSARSVLHDPLVKDTLAYLKLIYDPADSVALLRLLDSPFVKLTADDIYQFCKAKKSAKALIENLEEIKTLHLRDEANVALQKFFEIFKDHFAKSASLTGSQILTHLYEETHCIGDLLTTRPDSLRALGRFQTQLTNWEKSLGELSLKESYALLDSFLQYELALDQVEDEGSNAVSLFTIHASKGLEFDYVFIPSLVSRRIPSNFRQNTWIIPDALRKEAAPTKESHIEEERRLLYVAMTRAKKKLTLSCIDKKGTKPSIFLTSDLAALLNDKKIVQWKILDAADVTETLKEVFKAPKPFERIQATQITNGKTSTTALNLSFTQLEKYESCPLAYQFKYDFQIPIEIPAHMGVGSAIHSALEKFFEDIKAEKNPNEECLLEYFQKAFEEQKGINSQLTETHFVHGREKLKAYYEFHHGNFPYPHAIEKEFILPIGKHKVRGKIDRIDRLNNGYRIVDYKTGKAKSNENPEDIKYAKSSLQFSIYALAASEILSLDVRELVFDYIYELKTLTTQRTKEELENTKLEIAQIADNIAQSRFEPTPGRHCDWCEYRRICPAKK